MSEWETYQSGPAVRVRRRPVRHRATTVTTLTTPPDFSSLKKDELIVEAEKRGVDSSGTKADILERLTS